MKKTAEVYFYPLSDNASPEQMALAGERVFEACGGPKIISDRDFVALKLHVGEKGNETFIPPLVYRRLGDRIKMLGGQPFLTETSTLYRGERENAIKHILHAQQHGFTIEATGMPFILADGLAGNTETDVAIKGELNSLVKIAREILMADALVAIAHMTGHMVSGFGGVIKTLGMGLASRQGKLRQHSSIRPEIRTAACTFCQKCISWCPQAAIVAKNEKAFIRQEICIGCGECVAVCRFEAVRYNYGTEAEWMEQQMAEHALGVLQNKTGKSIFINAAVSMTQDCDCMNYPQKKLIPDLGFFASFDPVAVDQACQDAIRKRHQTDLGELSYPGLNSQSQLSHGEKIGLGSRQYHLHTVK